MPRWVILDGVHRTVCVAVAMGILAANGCLTATRHASTRHGAFLDHVGGMAQTETELRCRLTNRSGEAIFYRTHVTGKAVCFVKYYTTSEPTPWLWPVEIHELREAMLKDGESVEFSTTPPDIDKIAKFQMTVTTCKARAIDAEHGDWEAPQVVRSLWMQRMRDGSFIALKPESVD